MSDQPKLGSIGWIDLTVDDATGLRDFYTKVTGWDQSGVDMDGYQDFLMLGEGGSPVAGICHAKGPNAGIPPQWLIYVTVSDLDQAMATVVENDGQVVHGPRSAGSGRMCVIQDPSGAHMALYEGSQS